MLQIQTGSIAHRICTNNFLHSIINFSITFRANDNFTDLYHLKFSMIQIIELKIQNITISLHRLRYTKNSYVFESFEMMTRVDPGEELEVT